MSSDLSKKPMVLINLNSGSYTLTRTGHEYFNLWPNETDGRYYGYCPPYDDLSIDSLGAKKSDPSISGVLVVYVRKYNNTNDRIIVGFTDDATIYRDSKPGAPLNRFIKEKGEIIDCKYSIVSDTMYDLKDYPEKFIIPTSSYNPHMFRKHRTFKGTHPELDRMIIAYLERYLSHSGDEDSLPFQRRVLEENVPEGTPGEDSSLREPETTGAGNAKAVKKRIAVSKRALMLAHFECAADSSHKTFLTDKGTPYMEGHHLIPCTPDNAARLWKKKKRNIDCEANIVCLCPTCHRRVHFGSLKEKEGILKLLYDKQISKLRKAGLNLTFKELLSYYE